MIEIKRTGREQRIPRNDCARARPDARRARDILIPIYLPSDRQPVVSNVHHHIHIYIYMTATVGTE